MSAEPKGAPKLHIADSRKIREAMAKVNPGSAEHKRLMAELENLYRQRASG